MTITDLVLIPDFYTTHARWRAALRSACQLCGDDRYVGMVLTVSVTRPGERSGLYRAAVCPECGWMAQAALAGVPTPVDVASSGDDRPAEAVALARRIEQCGTRVPRCSRCRKPADFIVIEDDGEDEDAVILCRVCEIAGRREGQVVRVLPLEY